MADDLIKLWESFDEETKEAIKACFDEITVPERFFESVCRKIKENEK